MNEYYARLKPLDVKREHAMRVFVLGRQRFDSGHWVPVDREVAQRLRQVHQSYYDELSPLAFDVCTKQEWEALQPRPAASEVDPPQQETPESLQDSSFPAEAVPETATSGRGRKGKGA